MPSIPVLGKPRQEDWEFKTSLHCLRKLDFWVMLLAAVDGLH